MNTGLIEGTENPLGKKSDCFAYALELTGNGFLASCEQLVTGAPRLYLQDLEQTIHGGQRILSSRRKSFAGLSKWKAILAGCLAFVFAQSASASGHIVSVQKPIVVAESLRLCLSAEVKERASRSSGDERHSYHLSVELPEGLVPSFEVGSPIKVTLPTVHHSEVISNVASISKNRIELILINQVQELEGQQLKVDLPFKPIHLYRVPFQAIYSPRGPAVNVFVVSEDSTVRLAPVVPLEVSSDGMVLVSSAQLNNASVVVEGTDNLVPGDSVQQAQTLARKAL